MENGKWEVENREWGMVNGESLLSGKNTKLQILPLKGLIGGAASLYGESKPPDFKF